MPGDDAEVYTDALSADMDTASFAHGEDGEARALLDDMMERDAILESGSASDQFRYLVMGRERPRASGPPASAVDDPGGSLGPLAQPRPA